MISSVLCYFYFSFARAFINNEISLAQLSYAMRLGKLGEQFVLKSPVAFERIRFVSYEIADKIGSLNYDGVYLVKEAKRFYPNQSYLSHVDV